MIHSENFVEKCLPAYKVLDEIVQETTGSSVVFVEPTPMPKFDKHDEPHGRHNPDITMGHIWPVGPNSSYFTKLVGKGFVRRDFDARTPRFAPGIFDLRSKSATIADGVDAEPHFTDVSLVNYTDTRALHDKAADYELSSVQSTLLEGAFVFQDPETGKLPDPDSEFAPAAEAGHVLMALRALTDPVLRRQIENGSNPVNDWTAQNGGIVPHLNERLKEDVPGLLDISLDGGDEQKIVFRSEVIKRSAPLVMVGSDAFSVLRTDRREQTTQSARLILGLGFLAVQERLGADADLRLMEVIRQVGDNAVRIASEAAKMSRAAPQVRRRVAL